MTGIIIVFPAQKDGMAIRSLLVKRGYRVLGVCTGGDQVNQIIDRTLESDGIVISGYKYQDMTCIDLLEMLPETYQMIVMASAGLLERVYHPGVIKLPMPVRGEALVNVIEETELRLYRLRKKRRSRPKERSPEERAILDEAKALLISKKGMTEIEAHKYIQKNSMNNGTGIIEMAQMVIRLYSDEDKKA